MKSRMLFFVACIVLLSNHAVYPAPENRIDMADKIIKIKNYACFRFGAEGFGFYDWSDQKFKIFDWNLEVKHTVPIAIGEGPGEIKPWIYGAGISKNNILIHGFAGSHVHIYNYQKGTYLRSYPIDFPPRLLICHQNKLYLFNGKFFEHNNGPPLLVRILEPLSGKLIKDIVLKDKIGSTKAFDGISEFTEWLYRFHVDADSQIYILGSAESAVYKINQDGKLIKKFQLPYKFRMDYRVYKYDKAKNIKDVTISMHDLYQSFFVRKGLVYACFMKTLKQKHPKTGAPLFKTLLIKSDGKQFTEKEFDGDFTILGEHNDTLYLFDFDEYQVIPVKLDRWK